MLGLFRTVLMLLLLLVLARALLRFLGGVVQGVTSPSPPRGRASPAPTKMVRDPICGTYVVPGKAIVLARGKDTTFFCSEACRQKYLESHDTR